MLQREEVAFGLITRRPSCHELANKNSLEKRVCDVVEWEGGRDKKANAAWFGAESLNCEGAWLNLLNN